MKKILLFISLVMFSFASAQQYSSFDPKSYLLKRLEQYKSLDIDDLIHKRFYSGRGERNIDYIFAIRKKAELEVPGTKKISRIVAKYKWDSRMSTPHRTNFSNQNGLVSKTNYNS